MISKTIAAAGLAYVQAGDVNFWKGKAVYQVLTDRFSATGCGNGMSDYCGGSWKGTMSHLDYIKGLGFDAIWISPVIDNLDKGYHGYWGRNWEKVNDHFGSQDDLKALVDAAHSKGISVMVDVVANHVAPVGNDFSQIYPMNRQEHYHNNCDINWSD